MLKFHAKCDDNRDMKHPIAAFKPGQRVKCERDEALYPAKGAWLSYKGQVGTVRSVKGLVDGVREDEVGVTFTGNSSEAYKWFKPYELQIVRSA